MQHQLCAKAPLRSASELLTHFILLQSNEVIASLPHLTDAAMKVINTITGLPTQGGMPSHLLPPSEALFCLHKEQWMTPSKARNCSLLGARTDRIHRTERIWVGGGGQDFKFGNK